MIILKQFKVPVTKTPEETLREKIIKEFKISKEDLETVEILRQSVDARKKSNLFYVYNVSVQLKNNEDKILKRKYKFSVEPYCPTPYSVSAASQKNKGNIVVIGAGPAGLFAAYYLALSGLKPILLERGKKVEEREEDVLNFWKEGKLLLSSNVQFGEGGAGTFSDGKLNTLVKDKTGRNRFVLETFVKFGADASILYDFKPHIGTDVLITVIRNLRNELLSLGCEIRFETKVEDFIIEDRTLKAVRLKNEEEIPCEACVLAIGHSARDTFATLYQRQVDMKAKEFAIGLRVEHKRDFIDEHQYGPYKSILGAAPYKVATKLENGRGVYSFCMCPGGYVVNSSSEEGLLAVNGMSYSARDGKNSNSAIVVSVGKNEFDLNDPMAAIAYQRSLEKKAYELGSGKIPQQLYGDFLCNRPSKSYGSFSSMHKGDAAFCDLTPLFSKDIKDSFIEGMNRFEQKISGFSNEEIILSGVESRTSSPVRITRDENFISNIKGLYPCGEGAGYAGGITSAAMDGLKIGEEIASHYE
ncbi:MAG: FAD-dependent oxidoreductase [Lachnospiraceae bacterium]|nr:FAD-dependent oxidoreductase [Lachnospiraceae bacterium]